MNNNDTQLHQLYFQIKNQKPQLFNSLQPCFNKFLKEQSIEKTPSIQYEFEHIYIPLAQLIVNKHEDETLVVGLNGAQGSGKSTLAKIISEIIIHGFNKKILILSLDDFYKTRSERQQLAQNIHPLLCTRGVPGTHDVSLIASIINQLKKPVTKSFKTPVFDKSIDERAEINKWQVIDEKPDIIIFEGWCLGLQAEPNEIISKPINDLEKNKDADESWRRYVNNQLKNDYKNLFSNIDMLIMLKIPDFSKVLEWRLLQEDKLKQAMQNNDLSLDNKTMNESELVHFIMHFERLTQHALKSIPTIADVVLDLGQNHQIIDVCLNN